jgi:hypothetical protein
MSRVRRHRNPSFSPVILLALVLATHAMFAPPIFAQVEVLDQRVEAEDHAAGPASPRLGQTFTAGVSGPLTRLEIEVRSNASTSDQRVEILAVDAQGFPTGPVLAAGIIPAGATGWLSVSLDPAPSVSSGARYAFALPPNSGLAIGAGIANPYPGGAAVFATGARWSSPMPNADLHFRTYVLDPTLSPPDLTVALVNDTAGGTTVGTDWTWTARVANVGGAPVVLPGGREIFRDDLPGGEVSYGPPTVANATGLAGGENLRCGIEGTSLRCTAAGSGVTLGSGSSFEVAVRVTGQGAGTYANPAEGGVCQVDPGNQVTESDEGNNRCADTVLVRANEPEQPVPESVGETD